MKVPADVYARFAPLYRGLEDLSYPFHDQTIAVTHCGRIKGRKVSLSDVLAGQNVRVTQVGERIGSSSSCTTIWATSRMRRAGSN